MIADAIPGVNGAAFGRLKWAFLRVVFERGCASGMLNRVYSKLRLCACGVEPSSIDKGGTRGRLIWSPAVTKPDHSC